MGKNQIIIIKLKKKFNMTTLMQLRNHKGSDTQTFIAIFMETHFLVDVIPS